MSNEFHFACKKNDINDGEFKLVEIDETLVILSRIGDDFFCIDDVCTHDGGSLSDGDVENCQIACPRHGAKFDLKTGQAMTMPATQDTRCHKTKVDGDDVLVALAPE